MMTQNFVLAWWCLYIFLSYCHCPAIVPELPLLQIDKEKKKIIIKKKLWKTLFLYIFHTSFMPSCCCLVTNTFNNFLFTIKTSVGKIVWLRNMRKINFFPHFKWFIHFPEIEKKPQKFLCNKFSHTTHKRRKINNRKIQQFPLKAFFSHFSSLKNFPFPSTPLKTKTE